MNVIRKAKTLMEGWMEVSLKDNVENTVVNSGRKTRNMGNSDASACSEITF